MQDLINETGISYKRLSEVFNLKYEKSFFEVINEYRVQEALRLIEQDFHVLHTLPHLAEQAGFNSKATFNRAFKKFTGKTPTEYINSGEKWFFGHPNQQGLLINSFNIFFRVYQ